MDDREYKEKIEWLEKENSELKKWQIQVNQLLSNLLDVLDDQKKQNQKLKEQIATTYGLVKVNQYRIDSLPYELADPNYKPDFFYPQILSVEETRKQIINEGKSIARLGDGEFAAAAGTARWNFQGVSEKLGKRIIEVLNSNNENLLVGLNPNFYRALFDLQENDANGVRAYMRPEVRKFHDCLIQKNKKYANALFHSISTQSDVIETKKIWENKNIVLVEGQYTRMGVGNDLFDNAANVERILAPAENAFEKYEQIYGVVAEQPLDKLILAALGPTATVLAYDLCNLGYQAIDIGHVDLIYEKYLRGKSTLYDVKIPYKYCSSDEIGDRREIEEINNAEYDKQIIAKIY